MCCGGGADWLTGRPIAQRHIVPLLSVSVDFYIRVFVRVFTSAGECKFSPTKLSYVFQCVGCEGFHWQPLARTCSSKDGQTTRFMPAVAPTVSGKCEQCGWDFNMGGPFWNRPIHDAEFAKARTPPNTFVRGSVRV